MDRHKRRHAGISSTGIVGRQPVSVTVIVIVIVIVIVTVTLNVNVIIFSLP